MTLWRRTLRAIADRLPCVSVWAGFAPYASGVPKLGEAPLFRRYFLCRLPWPRRFGSGRRRRWGAVYLHEYLRSDPDRGLHDHPWGRALALPLAGGYDELRLAGLGLGGLRVAARRRRPGLPYLLTGADFHRLILGHGATSWSLFLHGPKEKGWGFLRGDADDPALFRFAPGSDVAEGRAEWWRTAPPGKLVRRCDETGERR